MIDDSWIERINDECEELVSEGLGHYLVSNEAGSIRALIIRLRQAEKDAARYRWLRDDAYNYLSGPMIFNCDYCGNPAPDDDGDVIAMVGGEIDSAIDEAMNASNN